VNEGPLDPIALLGALSECEVDFVVIGALAVGVHAEARSTGDVDVMVPTGDEANRRALEKALKKLNAVRIPAERGGIDPVAGDPYSTVMFGTRYGRLDVLYRPDGSDGYPKVKQRSVTSHIGGHAIKVAGRDDLVRMKLAAGRPDDLNDVASLTAAERGEPQRVSLTMKLEPDVDVEWAAGLAVSRVQYFDRDGRVWASQGRLKVEATRADLSPGQLREWAQALADRLHGAGVVAGPEVEVEIEPG
jgi:hypothetical protein